MAKTVEENIYADGSSIEKVKSGNKTDYYLHDSNASFENDPKGRKHGHVVIKDDKVAYVRNMKGESTNFDQDWEDNSRSSGGGCYIATASLQGAMPIETLTDLKRWRYEVLEKNTIGRHISNYYRRTAPQIANIVEVSPRIGSLLRTLIVKPAVRIANRPRSALNSILLLMLFMTGLSIAETIKLFPAKD